MYLTYICDCRRHGGVRLMLRSAAFVRLMCEHGDGVVLYL